MFNRDISRAFSRANTKPTQAFKDRLRARIVPDAAPRYAGHPFRMFALAGASLMLVLGAATLLSPTNVNKALASAIQNTFAFSTDGYHHVKIAFTMDTPGSTRSWVDEMWSDGLHALTETTGFDRGASFDWGSSYFDVPENIHCGIGIYQAEGECSSLNDVTQGSARFLNPSAATLMNIENVRVEHATDTHGDVYFTWITNNPLTNVTYIDTSYGPYGYMFGTWNGTYSWEDDSGKFVNRVTWFSENMTQSPFDEDTNAFLVQIQEIASENVGSYGAYEGEYLSQSPVYLIDLDAMTVTPVTDEWLTESRAEFDTKLIQHMASTETLAREYEQAFSVALDIGEHLNAYTLVQRDTTADSEIVTYDLGNADPILINTVQAARVEFTREVATNRIREMKLFGDDGSTIYHVQLQVFEESAVAPEGLFSREAWEARVKKFR